MGSPKERGREEDLMEGSEGKYELESVWKRRNGDRTQLIKKKNQD